jgi:uncharacterized protein
MSKQAEAYIEKYRAKLRTQMEERLRDNESSHDIYHHDRVANLGQHIQKAEGGEPWVIVASGLVHDIHRAMEKPGGGIVNPRDSLPTIREMLEEITFPPDLIPRVLRCVEHHEEYTKTGVDGTPFDIETKVLQDADRLDAIGAIGIGRTFTYMGSHGLPMWLPEIPLLDGKYDSTKRDISTLHHLKNKLLKLGEGMHTKTAQEMARERHEYLQGFFDRFLKEWEGKL